MTRYWFVLSLALIITNVLCAINSFHRGDILAGHIDCLLVLVWGAIAVVVGVDRRCAK